MRLDELLPTMFCAFFITTTGIVASMYIFCLIFTPEAIFTLRDIGRIMLMALASVLSTIIFYSRKELGKKQTLQRFAMHILVLLIILMYFTHIWGWVSVNSPKELALFIFLVLGVYIGVLAVCIYKDEKLSARLNESLRKRYNSQ